jgi:uracil-DNA glycosylase family 4
MVNGWFWRCANGTPCKACQEREGQFFPLSTPFQQVHDNCVCYPELSEVENPEYSEIVPEEEIPGLQRISFETNEPVPEVHQKGDENPMTYFSSFEKLWAHCQPALEGGTKLYVEKSGQRRVFSSRRELSILNRWSEAATVVKGGPEWAVLLKAEVQPQCVQNARAVFVAGSPNRIEVARGLPLAGEGRKLFRKSILEPAGLQEGETGFLYLVPCFLGREPKSEEIEVWRPWIFQQIEAMNPQVVVSLGKAAANEGLARISLPHPHAVLKHGDSGELARKVKQLKEALASSQGIDGVLNTWNIKEVPVVGDVYHAPIFKADEERRLVYGVIAESDMVDAQRDVLSAHTIEDMAHDFMMRFRRFDERHSWRQIEAMPVESWVFREDVTLFGQLIKAVSWVVGVKIFDDVAWQKIRSGEYRAFSIGGKGVRTPRIRFA